MKNLLSIYSTLLVLMLSPTAFAQDTLTFALEQCRTEQNQLKRLACYDEITIEPKLTQQATTQIVATETTKNIPQQQEIKAIERKQATSEFGREHLPKATDIIDTIYAKISKISYGPRKEAIIEFDNGQIWHQAGGGAFTLHVGQECYVKRGVLGAFYLGTEGSNRTLKVRRQE